ncbi:DUF5993 family protein [Burkholderia ubonensis]|uniref:DUF5993 family protein n=1 Tax=Burkholderia ubonensis TaxID=101571 RepID=UPI000AD71CE1
MFMFLPFLLALVTLGAIIRGMHGSSILMFLVTLIVTLASYSHHATDSLNLAF